MEKLDTTQTSSLIVGHASFKRLPHPVNRPLTTPPILRRQCCASALCNKPSQQPVFSGLAGSASLQRQAAPRMIEAIDMPFFLMESIMRSPTCRHRAFPCA